MDDDGPRRRFRHQRKDFFLPFTLSSDCFPIHGHHESKGLISLDFFALLPMIRVSL